MPVKFEEKDLFFFSGIKNCAGYETNGTFYNFIEIDRLTHGVTKNNGSIKIEFFVLGTRDVRIHFFQEADAAIDKRRGYEIRNTLTHEIQMNIRKRLNALCSSSYRVWRQPLHFFPKTFAQQ